MRGQRPIARSTYASSPRSPWRSHIRRRIWSAGSSDRLRSGCSPATRNSLTLCPSAPDGCRPISRSTSSSSWPAAGYIRPRRSRVISRRTTPTRCATCWRAASRLVGKRVRNGEARYSLSSNTDLAVVLLAMRRAAKLEVITIAQINSEMPFMSGDADVAPADFDFVLDSAATDFSLFAPPREPVDLTEYAAGLNTALLVPDGGTLQLGIGALGDAVAHALILRHRHGDAFARIVDNYVTRFPAIAREQGPFAEGLYGCSEMFVEGFLDLIRAGVVKREVGGALMHAGFFVGSRAFYEALREAAS